MSNTYIILALITSGVVTFAIRLFPFLVLRNQTKLSNRMQFISAVLPQAIITIQVVYRRNRSLLSKGYFVYKRTIWDSRTHCRRDCRLIAMVEGEYAA